MQDIGTSNAILIKSDVLWEALKIIKAFVSQNARLYVLQDAFYFNVVDEKIEIIATDTNNWIKVTFPVQIVRKSGVFCGILNFSKLHKFLDPKILPIQPITIRLGVESYTLEVIYEQGKTHSATESCENYPAFSYPTTKTSLGFVEMKDFYKKIKDLPQYRTSYNESFKLLASKTELKVFFLNEKVEKLLPQKGYFEVFDSEKSLFIQGMLNNFYKTEIFLKKDEKSKIVTQEELKNALKQKNADAIMILEDVLLKKEQVLPAQKEKKEKKEDVIFLNKVIEIDEDAFEPFDKGNYKEFSDKVDAFLRQYWRSENDFDTITNTQSGFVIGFDNTGIDELSGARRGETKMKALSQIKRIIEDGTLFTVREDKRNADNILAIYTFITYIKYKGQSYEYQFVVKHKPHGKFIYAVNLRIDKPLN